MRAQGQADEGKARAHRCLAHLYPAFAPRSLNPHPPFIARRPRPSSVQTKKKPPKKPLVKKKVVPPTSAHNHATQEEASTPSTAPPRMQQGELSSLEQAVGRHQTADDLNKFLAQEEEEYRRAKLASMSTNDVTTETDGKFGTSKASRSKGTKLAKKSSGE